MDNQISQAVDAIGDACVGLATSNDPETQQIFLQLATDTSTFTDSLEECLAAANCLGDTEKKWQYAEALSPIKKAEFIYHLYNCLCCIQESLKCLIYKSFNQRHLRDILKYPIESYKTFFVRFKEQVKVDFPVSAKVIQQYTDTVLFQLEWETIPITLLLGKSGTGKTQKQRELIQSHVNLHNSVHLFEPFSYPIQPTESVQVWDESNFDEGLSKCINEMRSRTQSASHNHLHIAIDEGIQSMTISSPALWEELWQLVIENALTLNANVTISLCLQKLSTTVVESLKISHLLKEISKGRYVPMHTVKIIELSK